MDGNQAGEEETGSWLSRPEAPAGGVTVPALPLQSCPDVRPVARRLRNVGCEPGTHRVLRVSEDQ